MKRIISLFMTAALITGSAVNAFAADGTSASSPVAEPYYDEASAQSADEKALEKAIKTVKSRIDISDDYEDFNFYKYTRNGKTVYSMEWNSGKSYISVALQGSVITGYSKYTYADSSESNNVHFAKKTKSQLKKYADNAVKQLNPTIYESIQVDTNSYSSYVGGTTARFGLARYRKGVPVAGNTGSITLNKDTGELMSFNFNWTSNAGFKSPETAITQEEAQSSYAKLIGIEPVYRVITDYSSDKATQKAILIYLPESDEKLGAFTGKITKFFNADDTGDEYYGETEDADMAAGEGGASNTGAADKVPTLSAAELKAVEKELGLITAKEAAAIVINDEYNAFTADYEMYNSYLRSDYYDAESFYWDISLSSKADAKIGNLYGNARVDAKTGAIISYNCYDYSKTASEITFDEKAADKLVKKALAQYTGDKFAEYKAIDSVVQSYTDYYTQETTTTGKYYVYGRYVNDIAVESDYISVTVDVNGKITNYNMQFTNVAFPSSKKMLSEADALSKLYAQQELQLIYYTKYANNKVSTALLYEMPGFTLDAVTGKLIGYDGTPIVQTTKAYTDISKHAIKDIAEKLAENGITLPTESGKLKPDSAITEADFIILADSISKSGDFYPMYSSLVYNYSTKAELSATISRKDAVKCLVIALGGKEFAELDIFETPFKDVKADSGYAGYFALAKGLGIFGKDASGNIKPDAALTRADALTMIYNYLNK